MFLLYGLFMPISVTEFTEISRVIHFCIIVCLFGFVRSCLSKGVREGFGKSAQIMDGFFAWPLSVLGLNTPNPPSVCWRVWEVNQKVAYLVSVHKRGAVAFAYERGLAH